MMASKWFGLPDGVYFDGTYEWELVWIHGRADWTPIYAPYGMPSEPDATRLRKVVKTYENIDWSALTKPVKRKS